MPHDWHEQWHSGHERMKAGRLCEFLDRLVVLFQRKKFVALFLQELNRLVLQGARRRGGGRILYMTDDEGVKERGQFIGVACFCSKALTPTRV